MDMSQLLLLGVMLGLPLGVLLDRYVLLELARNLIRNGWR